MVLSENGNFAIPPPAQKTFDAEGEALERALTKSLHLRNEAIKSLCSSVRRFRDATVKEQCKSDFPHASGALESVGSGGRPDSELSHVRTDEPRRKSLRSGNFRHGQRTLQLGSPSGGVNFFNAICRLLMYEGSFSTRFSDLPISADSLVCAEFVSAGVGLTSVSSVSIDPLQLINATVLSTAIILNSRQVGCTRSENALK